MIEINEQIPAFDTFCETLGYDPKSSLFFDIETTGFSPASSSLFLAGALYQNGGKWVLTQFLAESCGEEALVLQAFLALASRFNTLVHFNGNTFDLPYLTKKAAQYRLSHTLGQCGSLDLYQKFRPIGKLFCLERMNQISLEAFLHWQRTDRLTGKHMVTLFCQYAACGDSGIQKLLLLHNHDDMLGMTKLLEMASYLALFSGDFSRIEETRCHTKEDGASYFQVSFSLSRPVPRPVSTRDLYALSVCGQNASLTVPVCEGCLYHFFADYKNYYYLPLEDQAIHKSVAGYVDRAYRVPARASNCYIKKSGRFLPQPEEIFSPTFLHAFKDATLYFEFTEDFSADPEKLRQYVCSVMRSCVFRVSECSLQYT